ncbi:zinc finger protein CONSTANS-LIKE 5 [Lolium perenne]|uniref:zinc finger protein CONSTANS-LIKE 5 n=1 Tax=Lolium perenne TaxID=4522 RepID=UPI0021EAC2CE|nr:zinc finger protein CONSTANS-LIKE 5-like [Lolium perenne]
MMELRKYWGVGGRRCGACEGAPAAVHCRTCAGYLCTGCDARPAHARAGHERVWVCEVCEVNPAAVTCKADAAVLCAACDADIHDANPLAQRHVRVPVAPIGSPEAAAVAAEAMNMFAARSEEDAHEHGLQQEHLALNLNVEAGKEGGKQMDYMFSDLVDPYLGLEYQRFPHADSVVPSGAGAVPAVELDFACGIGTHAKPPPSYSSYTTTTSLAHSGSSSEVGVVPEATFVSGGAGSFELDFTRPKPQTYTSYTAAPPPYPSHGVSMHQVSPVDNTGYLTVPERAVAVTGEDREARLMRYREKRKNRRFEKTIRYASRKAYAESRPRVKGRFAKRADNDADDAEAEAEAEAHAVPSSYLLDFGYGVVPSF